MTYEERVNASEFIEKINKCTQVESQDYADYKISTYLDLVKFSSLPDESIQGKTLVILEPVRSYLVQFDNVDKKCFVNCM